MRRFILVISLSIILGFSTAASAALIDRGGGLIYDDDYDITWLQNANLSDGTMNWYAAMDWAEKLVYQGYDDWRLPDAHDLDGILPDYWNGTGSEMGHLYYTELGNKAYGPLENIGPFINVQSDYYWSETEYGWFAAWWLNFSDGSQFSNGSKESFDCYAWAVRTGNSAPVSIPGAVWLLGSGLIGLVVLRRKSS